MLKESLGAPDHSTGMEELKNTVPERMIVERKEAASERLASFLVDVEEKMDTCRSPQERLETMQTVLKGHLKALHADDPSSQFSLVSGDYYEARMTAALLYDCEQKLEALQRQASGEEAVHQMLSQYPDLKIPVERLLHISAQAS